MEHRLATTVLSVLSSIYFSRLSFLRKKYTSIFFKRQIHYFIASPIRFRFHPLSLDFCNYTLRIRSFLVTFQTHTHTHTLLFLSLSFSPFTIFHMFLINIFIVQHCIICLKTSSTSFIIVVNSSSLSNR